MKIRPRIKGADTIKYRLENKMIAGFMASWQAAGDMRPMQEIAVEYNDTVVYPIKVRLKDTIDMVPGDY